MTLAELEAQLRSRRARITVGFFGDDVEVLLMHVNERGKASRLTSAMAKTLDDAVELALMRYDAKW
jgi:hypothetical protein